MASIIAEADTVASSIVLPDVPYRKEQNELATSEELGHAFLCITRYLICVIASSLVCWSFDT